MKCKSCGAEMPDIARFCAVCGAKVIEVPPVKAEPRSEEVPSVTREAAVHGPSEAVSEQPAPVVSNSGDETVLFSKQPVRSCKNCGTVLEDGDTFCTNCGAKTDGIPTANTLPKKKSPKAFSNKRKFVIIAIAVAVLLCAAICAAVAVAANINNDSGTRHSTDKKYLNDIEYQQRIIEFDKILEIDPLNVSAYLGKAEATLATGDIRGAIEILEEGLARTGDERLQQKIDEINEMDKGIAVGYIASVDGEPIKGVKVTAKRRGDGNLLTGKYDTKSNSEGFWSLMLPAGEYEIKFDRGGYISANIIYVSEKGRADQTELITMYENSYRDMFLPVYGTVINGISGETVSGAGIKFRPGWNFRDGDYVLDKDGNVITAVSGSSGQFTAELPCGIYTAEISKEGFADAYVNVSAAASASGESAQLMITPALDENEYRFILTWGEYPYDLDSHLFGKYSDDIFEVFFHNTGYGSVVDLDVDDTSSYGPETITVRYDPSFGDFSYFVHDYSNRGSGDSVMLSESGAKVIVYKGNELLSTFYVPTGKSGTIWNVFSIKNGVLVSENYITGYSPTCYNDIYGSDFNPYY